MARSKMSKSQREKMEKDKAAKEAQEKEREAKVAKLKQEQAEAEAMTPPEFYLTELELAHIELHTTRIQMNQAQVEKFKAIEQIKKMEQQQELAIIRSQQRDAHESANSAANDFNNLIISIENRLGISMKEYSYDDQTGLLKYTGNLLEKDMGADPDRAGESTSSE